MPAADGSAGCGAPRPREGLDRGRQGLRRRLEPADRPGLAAAVAGAVGGQVHRHPADPGLGPVVVAQPLPAGRRPRECLLHDLLGLVEVAGHGYSWPTSRPTAPT
jgi:hypothetical protein